MNSFKELALYDMKSAKANYEQGLWNKVGFECQQACKKYMKHYLQEHDLLTEDLKKTQNLKKLIKAIPGYDKDLYKDLAVIGYYHIETNHPGDNFIELDKEMADEALKTANDLIAFIGRLKTISNLLVRT